jgi:hypothetical protein
MPPRLDHFRISVITPATLSHTHRTGLRRAVENCMVHNTLLNRSAIELVVEQAPAAMALSA